MKRFHSFRLDSANHCLWRENERISIPPKAFDVLRYLVEHPGRLVSQDEILEAVWPDTFVNPEVIKKYILGIRKVLGDSHEEPRFIETIPRRGYQFVAPVSDEHTTQSEKEIVSSGRMVGRESALSELDQYLKRALRGKRQLLFVTGEAGIGKTTLVDVFHRRVAAHANLRIARGQCVEGFGGKEAYYPLLDALGQLIRNEAKGPVSQVLAKLAPTWIVQFPTLTKPDQKEELQKETLGATRERMVRELCEALEVITAEAPLVLILEDLHWVDASTLDLLSALARRREAAKLLVICTYRPVDVLLAQSPLKDLKRDLQVHGLCTEIALERFETSDVDRYLAAEFANSELPRGLAGLVHRHSGGNALFMAAIVQDMVKRGFILRHDQEWRLSADLEDIDPGVPETLQQMLEVQFERLSPNEQRVLKSGSILGERFCLWAISTTFDIEPDELEEICDRLAERQQFLRAGGVQELTNGVVSAHYEFRHSLYRQAIYRGLSEGTRLRLHRKIAERLKELCTLSHPEIAAELALHFEAARDYKEAVRHLTLAAENAATRFAYRDSIAILQHALELIPHFSPAAGAELEVRTLQFIGDAHYTLGAMPESAENYRKAVARAASVGLISAQVSALTSLVRPLAFIDPEQGLAAMDQAVQVGKDCGDPVLLARTQLLASACRLLYDKWSKEDADQCITAHQTLRNLGDADTPALHKIFYAKVQVLRGNFDQAFAIFESVNPQMDHRTTLMAHFFNVSGKTMALLRAGRLGDVLQVVRTGRENAEKNGNDPWLFDLREAWLRTLALDFEGSRRICDRILRASKESCIETIARLAKGYAYVAAGFAELERGDFQQALDFFRRVRDPKVTPQFFLHWILRLTAQLGMGSAWLNSGNISNAHLEADNLLEAVLSIADPHLRALAWDLQARVAAADNNYADAMESICQATSIVEEFQIPVAAWQVHATAWEFYDRVNDRKTAEQHRMRARESVLKIAESFSADEPLRELFLSARPVSGILGGIIEKEDIKSPQRTVISKVAV